MELPILFNDEMVRATLDGRKTMTRRPMKPQPIDGWEWIEDTSPSWFEPTVIRRGEEEPGSPIYGVSSEQTSWPSPFGQPGDTLWIRESWRVYSWHEGEPIRVQFRDGSIITCLSFDDCDCDEADYLDWEERMLIQSSEDCEKAGMVIVGDCFEWPGAKEDLATRWRPNIHMPRWAAGHFAEVVRVWVERLGDISEDDAKAEGVLPRSPSENTYRAHYVDIMDAIYPGIAEENRWLWVCEFKRLEAI